MATLDDRLLGEKKHYYCSSSSEDEDDIPKPAPEKKDSSCGYRFRRNNSSGMAANTGPKGVIQDFQMYKKFESEQKQNKDGDKLDKMKKLSLSCRNHNDEKIDKKASHKEDELDDENDPFIKEYISKRMKEMLEKYEDNHKVDTVFGQLELLSSGVAFLNLIEDPYLKNIVIVTHVYNDKYVECKVMNRCLNKLANKYEHVKFGAINASIVGMSYEFTRHGVPALLVYKSGELIGNFVSLSDEFGQEFNENDVEDFLVENNILVSSELISSISYNSNLSKAHQNGHKNDC